MPGAQDAIFAVRITRPMLERLPRAELEDMARGLIFVPAIAPPRVGVRVRIDVSVDEDRVIRQSGLVVWARPAQRGRMGGFRAQLENAAPTLLRRLKVVVDAVRLEFAARPGIAIEAPIHERVSYRGPAVATLPPLAKATLSIEDEIDIAVDASFLEATVSRSRTRIRRFKSDQATLPPLRPGLPGPAKRGTGNASTPFPRRG